MRVTDLLLPGILVVFVLVALGGIVIYSQINPPDLSGTHISAPQIDGISCDASEHLGVRHRVHVAVYVNNEPVQLIPALVGVISADHCWYWLHTTDDTGLIDIFPPQAQADREFTLGNFFDIWHQPLTVARIGPRTVKPGQTLHIFIDDGSPDGPQPYKGDPRRIVLAQNNMITIQINSPSPTWDPFIPPYHFPPID